MAVGCACVLVGPSAAVVADGAMVEGVVADLRRAPLPTLVLRPEMFRKQYANVDTPAASS